MRERTTNHLQNGHLHHTLVEVSGLIFHDFYRHNLVSLHVLTFDDLTERALTKNIQYEIPAITLAGSTENDCIAHLLPFSGPNQSFT